MKKKLSSVLAVLFMLGDLLILNLALSFSYMLRDISFLDRELTAGLYLLIFSNIAWLFLILVTNPYRLGTASPRATILRSHLNFIFVHLLVVLSLVFFYDKRYDTVQLLLLYVFFIPTVYLWRLFFFYVLGRLIDQEINNINYVIIGRSDLAMEIRRNYGFHPEYGYKFLGYFDESSMSDEEGDAEYEIQKFCLDHGVAEIYWCLPDQFDAQLKRLIDFGLNSFIKIKRVSDYRGFYQKGIEAERYRQMPVADITAIPLDDPRNQFIKRTFDLLFAAVVSIALLSWLVPLIALIIRLDSRGPVIYRQPRAGKGNKPFLCLKFRTMVVEQNTEFVQATRNDPRVTRIGKLLRKTSLDEFPQFFNVLKGEMSIVGPRPHPIKLNDDFSPRIKKLQSRHYVKPGITGLAQCMGYRGETVNLSDMKNRVTLDRFYVENWSLLFDVRIIFQTVFSLFAPAEKAY